MQDIFLVAQNSDEHQLQQYAAWAVSFLRHHMWSKELLNSADSIKTNVAGSNPVSQSFSDDNVVMRLSLWLMHLSASEVGLLLEFLWFHYELMLFQSVFLGDVFSQAVSVQSKMCVYTIFLSIVPFFIPLVMVITFFFFSFISICMYVTQKLTSLKSKSGLLISFLTLCSTWLYVI